MNAEPLYWGCAALAVLIAGVAKGGFGGGPAMLATPVFALGSDVITAAAVMLPVLIAMDVVSARTWWRRADWSDLRLLLPAATLGIALGWALFSALEPRALQFALGGLAAGFALWQFAGGVRVARASLAVAGLSGLTAGFSSTIAHAGGPPISVYLLARRHDKAVFVATGVVFFAVANALKLVPYAAMGMLPQANLLTSLALLPLAWAGVRLGVWLHHQISVEWFYKLAYSALLAVGVLLIGRALSGG